MHSVLEIPEVSERAVPAARPEQYRIVAASPSKPDDVVLLDSNGHYRLYIGSTGSVSRGTLNAALVAALLERENWGRVKSEHTVTIDELQQVTLNRGSEQSLWE
jgi:hypothetical protein